MLCINIFFKPNFMQCKRFLFMNSSFVIRLFFQCASEFTNSLSKNVIHSKAYFNGQIKKWAVAKNYFTMKVQYKSKLQSLFFPIIFASLFIVDV